MSLFGNTGSGTGLFGSSSTPSANTGTANIGGGPFGGSGASTSKPDGPVSSGTTMPGGGTSLFGSGSSMAGSGGSLFGSLGSVGAAATTASIGSGNATVNTLASAGSRLFGGSSASKLTTAPATTSSAMTAATGTEGTATPNRRTKFVDLPQQVKDALRQIEVTKKQQILMGEIFAKSTQPLIEKQCGTVGTDITKLRQNLDIVKRMLTQDHQQINEAKHAANESLRDIEMAVSLITQAVDGTTGGKPTPLLETLQQQQSSKAPLAAIQAPGTSSTGGVPSQPPASVDPYEISRRIQQSLLASDITAEFFWKWLTQVEVKMQALDTRVSELRQHVDALIEHSERGMSGGPARPNGGANPQVVADILKHQYTSFMAQASKLSRLNDDISRLKQRLSIKE